MADINRLIKALRTSADKVDGGSVYYCWSSGASCNCGILAQEVLDISERDLLDKIYSLSIDDRTWTSLARKRSCSLTGTSIPQIIERLKKVGFKRSNFTELEYLSNRTICKRAKIDTTDYHYFTYPSNFVKYTRAWADILEEQLEAEKSIQKTRKIIKDVNKLVAKPLPKIKTLTRKDANHANSRESRSKVVRSVNQV